MFVDDVFFLVQVELLSGGVNMPVTPLNVYEYVRKYAEHRMLVVAEQPLHVSKPVKKCDSLLTASKYIDIQCSTKLHLKVSVFLLNIDKCFVSRQLR